ncbi:MAG: lipase family protein [Mycobacteriaceae bacterium]
MSKSWAMKWNHARLKPQLIKTAVAITLACSLATGPAPAIAEPVLAGFEFDVPEFYDTTTIDFNNTNPGHIFREEHLPPPVPGISTATRILYHSTTDSLTPVGVSGVVLTSSIPWTRPGPRPVLGYAVGTHGLADQCAPSRQILDPGQPGIDPEGELVLILALIAQGYSVVVTDYIGLGTPGIHSYLNGEEEGNALLDAVRAAQNLGLPELTHQSPVILYGVSQGGGAVVGAAERAGKYAPELNIKAAAAGMPANPTIELLSNSPEDGIMEIIALMSRNPEYEKTVRSIVTDDGWSYLQKIATTCIVLSAPELSPQIQATNSGEGLFPALISNDDIYQAITSQTLGRQALSVPTAICSGPTDSLVPEKGVLALIDSWRSQGSEVEYFRADAGPELFKTGHAVTGLACAPLLYQWIADQLNT